MRNWFLNNWDKVIVVIISICFGGITGFYSSSLQIEKDFSLFKERLKKNEVEINYLKKQVNKFNSQEKDIRELYVQISYINGKNESIDQFKNEIKKTNEKLLFFLEQIKTNK